MTKKAVNIFCRKFFILNGDFRQVLPVVQYGGRAKEMVDHLLDDVLPLYLDQMQEYKDLILKRDSGTNKHRDARRKEEIAVRCVKSTSSANLLRKLIKGIAQQF